MVSDATLRVPLEKLAFIEVVKSGSRFTADRLYYIANELQPRQEIIGFDGELPFFFECTLSTQAIYVGEAKSQIESVNFTRKLLSRSKLYTIKLRMEGKGKDINKTYLSSVYKSTSPLLIKKKINSLLKYLNDGDYNFYIKQFIES